MDKLKIIKAAVFVMTLLLITGIVIAAVGLMNRKKENNDRLQPVQSIVRSNRGDTNKELVEIWLGEYEGSEIRDFKECGYNLCVSVTGGGEGDRIIAVNAKGEVVKKIYVGSKLEKTEK